MKGGGEKENGEWDFKIVEHSSSYGKRPWEVFLPLD